VTAACRSYSHACKSIVFIAALGEISGSGFFHMHKAPNAVEQRKHEYHPCPPEKVEAIKDALRHFGLIAE
jgi:site-specific DNA recombinase